MRASTTSRQTAPITQAMATHRKESISAADQSMDGLNGVGPNFDVSLLSRHPGEPHGGYFPAKVPEDGG